MINDFFDLSSFEHKALWDQEINVWSPLLTLSSYLKQLPLGVIEISVPKSVHIESPENVSIGKGTVLEPGVFIQGPCVIGENCVIRHGAYLRGGVLCGKGCSIGHSAEIKGSILLNGAAATHFVYVGDSILGNDVNLGAGVKCANLRLDRRKIRVFVDGVSVETPLGKMGVILGDNSQIGCNCVINPGTLLPKGSQAPPLSVLGTPR